MILFFLPAIVVVGIATSYEDVRFGKIRNKWIILGIVYGAVLHVCFLLEDNEGQEALFLLSNAVLSFIVGYALWIFRLWSAGDAKLFIVFSFLIPVNNYMNPAIKFFPSYILLINIFVPVCFILLAIVIYYFLAHFRLSEFNMKEKLKFLKEKKGEYLSVFSGYLVILLFTQFLMQKIRGALKPFSKEVTVLTYLFPFLLYRQLYPLLKRKSITNTLVAIFIIFALYTVVNGDISGLNYVSSAFKKAFLYMVAGFLILKLLQFYIEKVEVKMIKIVNLSERDVLTEKAIANLKEKCTVGKYYADGLTAEDVALVKSVCKEDEETEIYNTVPFAPLAFCGVLITLVLKQSVARFVFSMMK